VAQGGRCSGPLGPDHAGVELHGPPAGQVEAAQDVLVGADPIAHGDRPLDQVTQVGGLTITARPVTRPVM
jgi:hypothetical protein